MENYVCTICGKVIKDFNNGLFVKIKDQEGNLLQVVPVHKGSCDDTLYKIETRKGLNANSSMEISFFSTEKERTEYLNGRFSMTDE